jgi:hypothetical protein
MAFLGRKPAMQPAILPAGFTSHYALTWFARAENL